MSLCKSTTAISVTMRCLTGYPSAFHVRAYYESVIFLMLLFDVLSASNSNHGVSSSIQALIELRSGLLNSYEQNRQFIFVNEPDYQDWDVGNHHLKHGSARQNITAPIFFEDISSQTANVNLEQYMVMQVDFLV